MKLFSVNTTIGDILDDMIQDDQAMSVFSLSQAQGKEPDFVVVCAARPYSEAILALMERVRDTVTREGVGEARKMEYTITADGQLIPLGGGNGEA